MTDFRDALLGLADAAGAGWLVHTWWWYLHPAARRVPRRHTRMLLCPTGKPQVSRLVGMRNHTRALPLALAAAAVLTAPACGFTISAPTAAPAPVSAPAPDSEPEIRPAEMVADPEEDLSLDDAAELIRPFLLTADEIGPGFTPGAEPQPDPATPAICGGRSVVAQFPIAVRVGSTFAGPVEGVQVTETVSVYEDADTARAAYQAGVDGVDCGEGTVAGESVAIVPAEDLTYDVGGEQATGRVLGNENFDVIIVTVQSDAVVWNFTYLAYGDTLAELPDAVTVSAAGVEKLDG